MALLKRRGENIILDRIPDDDLDMESRTASDGILKEFRNYNDPRLTKKQIVEAIVLSGGKVMKAAKILKCHYQTLNKYIQRDEKLQNMLTDIEELNLDLAEDALNKLISQKNLTAIIFYLKCRGRKRGWIENEQLITHLDKPIIFNYKLVTNNDNRTLPDNSSNGSSNKQPEVIDVN